MNEQLILPMAAHFRHSGHVLRFIEYMGRRHDQRLAARRGRPAAQIIPEIDNRWPLAPVDPAYPGEVARPDPATLPTRPLPSARWAHVSGLGVRAALRIVVGA